MRYYGFDEHSFRHNVDEALKSVDRILEVHRKPHLAENVDHEYNNKYDLANQMTNVGIIALMNCLEQFGLTADVLKGMDNNNKNNQATTLRFQASDTCTFLKENEVEVPMEQSLETTEETKTSSSSSFFGSTTKATISRVVNRVKEYHWKVGINWEVSLYSGTDIDQKTILDIRSSSMILVTQSNPSKRPPLPQHRDHTPIDVSLTWFLQQIHKQDLVSQFKIDTADPKTKTPLRNEQVEDAMDAMRKLSGWAAAVSKYFTHTLHLGIIKQNNPATGPVVDEVGSWESGGLFNPVQPIMEEENTTTTTNGSPESDLQAKAFTGLPKDWVEAIDESSGIKYYFNTLTQETSWEKPTSTLQEAEVTEDRQDTFRDDDGTYGEEGGSQGSRSYYSNERSYYSNEEGSQGSRSHYSDEEGSQGSRSHYSDKEGSQGSRSHNSNEEEGSQGSRSDYSDEEAKARDNALEPSRDDTTDVTDQKSILGLPKEKTSESSEGKEKHTPILSRNDITNIINEHVRSIAQKIKSIQKSFPAKHLMKPISVAEATFVVLCGHIQEIQNMYRDSMNYIEWMLEQQLIAAIGKRVDSSDLDKFVKYHNAKLIRPAPKPFCHSIRRPDHYPDGVLSIEGLNTNNNSSDKKEPIDTFVREVQMTRPLQVPLTAASTLELTGKAFLHGWLQHRFQNTSKTYDLIARARQFSSFMLVVGTMAGSNELDPKDAIILQNKDEVIIPLLLNELPSAKEFKDAIQSLSPEQQRFARSFRSMQLESSVLGVCIIQIKPQLEKLLGLPPDALTKEMKLTQDLMELFVEHQVPSDLLSYDGETTDSGVAEKVENVKSHVASVMEVVDAAKTKQLQEQEQRAKMAEERAKQQAERAERSLMMRQSAPRAMVEPPRGRSGGGDGRRLATRAARQSAPHVAPSSLSVQSQAASLDALTQAKRLGQLSVELSSEVRNQSAMLESVESAIESVKSAESGGAKPATRLEQGKPAKSEDEVVDFTAMPKMLDSLVDEYDKEGALRSTVVKTADRWVRRRKENLLSDVCVQNLRAHDIASEKNKCFDLLDALCRSGSLPIDCSELHVIICLTHRFEKDVMGTIIKDNINPIEKLEYSTLLFASALHGVAPRKLASDEQTLKRLSGVFPLLLKE